MYGKYEKKASKIKTIVLKPKMTLGDLEIKAAMSKELAKKSRTVMIIMNIDEKTEDTGYSLFLKFRDLVSKSLSEEGELETRTTSSKDDQELDMDEDDKGQYTKRYTQKVFNEETRERFHGEKPTIDKDQVKKQINNYFLRSHAPDRKYPKPDEFEKKESQKDTEFGQVFREIRKESEEDVSTQKQEILRDFELMLRKDFKTFEKDENKGEKQYFAHIKKDLNKRLTEEDILGKKGTIQDQLKDELKNNPEQAEQILAELRNSVVSKSSTLEEVMVQNEMKNFENRKKALSRKKEFFERLGLR